MAKILIIDDDNIVVFVQQKILQKCGVSYVPLAFKEAQEGLDYLQTESIQENEFLIFLDINMPSLSGWEFLEKLEQMDNSEKVRVIMVTSSIDAYDKKKAEGYKNVFSFIEKPITVEMCNELKARQEISKFFQ